MRGFRRTRTNLPTAVPARFFESASNEFDPVANQLRPQAEVVVQDKQGKQAGKEVSQEELWKKVKQGSHLVFQDNDWDKGIVHIDAHACMLVYVALPCIATLLLRPPSQRRR